MYFLGIDIGKRTHVASIMNEEGKVLLKGFSFPNTTEGAESLIERMVDYSGAPSDFVIGMEATGHYWLSIFSYLHESDYLIHVVNPLQTDGWRKGTEIRKRKNDIIDSVLIADLMRYGSFVETVLSDENVFSNARLNCLICQPPKASWVIQAMAATVISAVTIKVSIKCGVGKTRVAARAPYPGYGPARGAGFVARISAA